MGILSFGKVLMMQKRYVHAAFWISIITILLSTCSDQTGDGSLALNRLDPNVHPIEQKIELNLDPALAHYSGDVIINLRVVSSTSTFRFHAQSMNLTSILLTQGIDTFSVSTSSGAENIMIASTTPLLEPGDYKLEISFQKEYNRQTVGLYQVEYEDFHYLFTQLEAVDARRAFPCWDEPQYKIPWQLTLNIPEHQLAVSNTPIEARSQTTNGQKITFQQTKPLPSYLIAIAVGPFERVPLNGLSVPGYLYCVRGKRELTGMASNIAAPILQALEDYFKIPYPYEKLDFIAVPEFWPGGMENAGAITYADRIVLLEKDQTSISQRRRLAAVVAHEIAHQWFGDYVTMEWWDDLWLNESFADWMDHKITTSLYPEFRSELNAMRNLQGLMDSDARITTRPIQKQIRYSSEIFEDLGLAYGKGTQILNMVEQWVGPEKFQGGVLSYLNANAWGNAKSTDLWAELSQVSGEDVNGVLTSFVTQSSLPLLKFEPQDENKLHITQERYVNKGVQADPQMWKLPVDFKYRSRKGIQSRTVLLADTKLVIQFDEELEWILPNTDAMGYYRWIVPDYMFETFSTEPTHYLDAVERIAFLGNAEALLKAGYLEGDRYLALLEAFANDPEPDIVESVLNKLNYIAEHVLSDDHDKIFAAFIQSSLKPALREIGLETTETEGESIPALRSRLIRWLASEGQDNQIEAYSDSLAAEYLVNPEAVHHELINTVLVHSARHGDEKLFSEYQIRFETASSSLERQHFLSALGQFSDEMLQDRALDYVINGPLRTNELVIIPNGVRNTEAGKDKVLNWVLANYTTLVSRMPSHYAATMLGYAANGSNSKRIREAHKFIDSSTDLAPGTQGYLRKIEELVLDRERLRKTILPSIERYLEF